MTTTDQSFSSMEEFVAACREPFSDIGQLPKTTCRDCVQKSCQQHHKARCSECNAFMTTAHMHISYVGHAAVTDRMLSVDPVWSWQPFAVDERGLPAVIERDNTCILWIRLTVNGVTRPGVGTVAADKAEVHKELISDALRNAAMRFGIALDQWSKQELESAVTPGHDQQEESAAAPPPSSSGGDPTAAEKRAIVVNKGFLTLKGQHAQQAKKALEKAGLWPVLDIADDRLDEAADVIAPIIEAAQNK